MIPKISERTLRKWRTEALRTDITTEISMHEGYDTVIRRLHRIGTLETRVLCMTQELLDQHLIKSRK